MWHLREMTQLLLSVSGENGVEEVKICLSDDVTSGTSHGWDVFLILILSKNEENNKQKSKLFTDIKYLILTA